MNAGWTLSIDFGTTNTVAAVRSPGGEARSVRLSSDTDQLPSGVFADDQGIVVGQPAAMRAQSAPSRFEANPKRRIGDETARLGPRTVAVAELVAAVLRQAATRAAMNAGGSPPAQVILTHPEAWARQRIGRLAHAAELAGLGQVRMLPEPVAAAMWYLRATQLPAGGRVAVFDFGGGTCDAAVLRADPGSPFGFVVLAAGGEDQLGGEHIDRRLLDWVDTQLRASGRAELADRLEHPDEVASWLTLRDQVRSAKHALSEYPSAHIAVRTLTGTASLLITVDEFERLIAQDVDRAVALAARVLDEAGPESLTAFYLTGGTSLIPVVQRRITALLGWTPATLDDPKLVVALGAAAGAPTAPPVRAPAGALATRVMPADPRPPVPRPASRTRWLVAGIVAAVLLVVSGGVGAAALLSRTDTPGPSPPGTSTLETGPATGPTTTVDPAPAATPQPTSSAPATITLPAEMAATFPALSAATNGATSAAMTCAERDVAAYPSAGDGEKPIFVVDCSYADQQGSVAFIQWANQATGPRFVSDLRAGSTAEEQFATWEVGGVTQGPYLATTNSSDTANPYYLWASFDRRPCSFAVSGPTLELANALYSTVANGLVQT
jgi:actin-like ATPase involved in cell morphogenesis